MRCNMLNNDLSDATILKELGNRVARYRLNRNMSQLTMAKEAGVSKSTIQRIEGGSSIQMTSLIRVLRILELIENLDKIIPRLTVSPMQQLKLEGKIRKRASLSVKEKQTTKWEWGNKK